MMATYEAAEENPCKEPCEMDDRHCCSSEGHSGSHLCLQCDMFLEQWIVAEREGPA